MSSRLADIIFYIHGIIFLSGFLVPFSNNYSLLCLYSIGVPFLLLHWSLNDDTCAITVLEQILRGEKDRSKTFVGQIMKGIYILPDEAWSKLLKLSYFSLWLLVQWRLNRLY